MVVVPVAEHNAVGFIQFYAHPGRVAEINIGLAGVK